MLSETVNAWLRAPDNYQTGLELLRETGFKGFTLGILSKGEDKYNRTRLVAELRKWLELPNNSSPVVPAAGPIGKQNLAPVRVSLDYGVPGANPVVVATKPAISLYQASPADPPAITAIRKEISALMDERSEAKAWLRAKADLGNSDQANAIRYPKTVLIKVNTRQIDELYSRIGFFIDNGYLAPASTNKALVVDDTKLLLNMRSYVSRYKGELKKKTLTPAQRQSAEKLLKHYSDEKIRLELKLSPSVTPLADEK